jgi:hypothetical protein
MSRLKQIKDSIENRTNEFYNQLSIEERQEVYELFFNSNTAKEIKQKLEKVIFYKKPPTVDEFLNPENKWLPYNVVQSIFPHVISELKEILNPDKTITKVVEYGATRLGKTFMARLMILYTIIYIHHLREPAMYYGLSPLTRLCIYFISFKFDKTRQLYLEPMYEIMRQSERFHQVKFQDKVRDLQNKIGRDTIVWSKAATTGEMTLASGLQLQMGNSDAISAIGSDPLQCYISEIGYFIEQEGTTEEKIFELYTNISTRIYSTVKENFLAFVYLDTSANNADSMIEKHIINELQTRPKVHFKWQSQWDARPDLFPIWQKTGETFTVVVGNGNINPCIVEDEKQLEGVPKDLIIEVPIDALQFFKDNLIKEIKDIAGRPTQSENKFIQDIKLIDRIFDNPILKNIEGALIADSATMPEQLLWNQIKNKFFYINPQNQYKIVRAPNEWRYVSWDNAYSLKGDVMGINIKHKEWSRELNQVIYVNDLSCIVKGTDKGINLDAPKYLIIDLLQQAGLPVYAVYSDTFQSESQKQFLERCNVQFLKQSVDRTLSPYQFYLTCLMNGVLKSGKNIFLKNNLNCLMLTRNENGHEKVDHPLGQRNHIYNGDWEKSTAGCFAKDASDADCQTLWGAFQHNYIPSTCYEDENKRLSNNKEDTLDFAKIAIQNLVKSRIHY